MENLRLSALQNSLRSSLSGLWASPALRLGLGLAVSGLSLYLALRNVTLAEVGSALGSADLRFVALALASVALNTLAKTARWRVLLGAAGRHISLYKLLQSLLVGQMLNTLYPARIGDLSRAYLVGGMGPGRVFTLGTILIEKVLDLVAYCLLFALLVVLIPLPPWVDGSLGTLVLVAVLAGAAVLLLAYRPAIFLRLADRLLKLMPARVQAYTAGRLRSGIASLEILHSRPGMLGLGFWTALSWLTAVLNNVLALLALRIFLPWTAALLVLIILQAGISIPSVPGRIGVFEYMCVLGLAVYGIDQAPALSYGIVLHAIVLLPTTLLGLLFFWSLGLARNPSSLLAPPSE